MYDCIQVRTVFCCDDGKLSYTPGVIIFFILPFHSVLSISTISSSSHETDIPLYYSVATGYYSPRRQKMAHFPTAAYLNQVTGFYELLVRAGAIADVHTDADTWTIRNHVAHLIDSASNNHQRFIRLQLAENVVLPGYAAEPWVNVSGISRMEFRELILLWKLYNEYLIELIDNIKEDSLAHTWQPENGGSPLTLEYLVQDYYSHMKVHEDMIAAIIAAARK
jgi:hypothetical protein